MDNTEIFDKALIDFNKTISALEQERNLCISDRRFYSIAGAQWKGKWLDQFENRPKLEFNKIHLAVIRIINEYRNNKISVQFLPKNGEVNQKLSDFCSGLYRVLELSSCGQEAYDNAFEEAVGGGFGAWRLRACYENELDEDDDEQIIKIEPIFDADISVFFDCNSKMQDKSDAKFCFVLNKISIDDYKDEYDDNPEDWPDMPKFENFEWVNKETVTICEYYKVCYIKDKIRVFKGLDDSEEKYKDSELKENEDKLSMLLATGYKEIRSKKIKTKKIKKYLMSGVGIIEDCGYIAGCEIPIIPVFGKRWFVDGIERCMGHVRLSRDSQILSNIQRSRIAEISSLSALEKPYFTPEQIIGHTLMHEQDNVKNYPYLLLNSLKDENGQVVQNGPIGYSKPPNIPPAIAALIQIVEKDMEDILGNQQAGEKLENSVSGVAVELIQNKLDMQTFIYMSNMAKAVKRSGEVWLGMAKEVYSTAGRNIKIIGGDDKPKQVELLKPMVNLKTNEIENENDLTNISLDIVVDVGPMSASRRAATVRGLTGMMQISQDPETISVLGGMAMTNMEGEGIDEVRSYFRKKLIKMGVIKPTDDEGLALQQELQNQKPDANTVFVQASAAQAAAQAKKAEADTILQAAKAEQVKADTAKMLADMDMNQRQHVLEMLQQIQKMNQNSNNQPPNSTQTSF